MNTFAIKTLTKSGIPARTYICENEGDVTIIRRLLVPITELPEFPNYSVMRTFKDKELVETFIPFKKETIIKVAFLLYKILKMKVK
jgi:hypothetical protein